MIFKPEEISTEAEYNNFISFMNLDSNVTFEFVTEQPNRHYPEKSFLRYQQYIDGIPIQGGGVVVSGIFAPGTGPGGPGGPCSRIMMLVPHIANNVDINLNPTLDKFQALNQHDTLGTSSPDSLQMIEANLVVTSNINNDCNYHLTWKFIYLNELGSEKYAYVDAHTGVTLISGNNFDLALTARTDHYGIVSLDNFEDNGESYLISPDERILAYHYKRNNCDYDRSH